LTLQALIFFLLPAQSAPLVPRAAVRTGGACAPKVLCQARGHLGRIKLFLGVALCVSGRCRRWFSLSPASVRSVEVLGEGVRALHGFYRYPKYRFLICLSIYF